MIVNSWLSIIIYNLCEYLCFSMKSSAYQVITCDSCFRSSFRELGAAALWQKHEYWWSNVVKKNPLVVLHSIISPGCRSRFKFGICHTTLPLLLFSYKWKLQNMGLARIRFPSPEKSFPWRYLMLPWRYQEPCLWSTVPSGDHIVSQSGIILPPFGTNILSLNWVCNRHETLIDYTFGDSCLVFQNPAAFMHVFMPPAMGWGINKLV